MNGKPDGSEGDRLASAASTALMLALLNDDSLERPTGADPDRAFAEDRYLRVFTATALVGYDTDPDSQPEVMGAIGIATASMTPRLAASIRAGALPWQGL